MSRKEDQGSHQLKRYENGGSGAYPEGHDSPTRASGNPPRVVPPEEPPDFTPEAVRALLRIIRTAYARRSAEEPDPSSPERRT